LKVFLDFYAVANILETTTAFRNDRKEKELKMLYFGYLVFAIVTTFINVFSFTSFFATANDSLGVYMYQISFASVIMSISAYVPLLVYLGYRIMSALKKIEKKAVKQLSILVGTLFSIFILERLFNVSYYWTIVVFPLTTPFFSNTTLVLLCDFILVSSLLFVFVMIEIISKEGFMESFSSYLSVESVYLIRKSSGMLLYGHEFTDVECSQTPVDRFLLGGFIYAVSNGLERASNINGKVDAIKIGNTTLILKYSKDMIGVVFASDHTRMIDRKLELFMERFEWHYKDVFKEWCGKVDIFDHDLIEAWIQEIFR